MYRVIIIETALVRRHVTFKVMHRSGMFELPVLLQQLFGRLALLLPLSLHQLHLVEVVHPVAVAPRQRAFALSPFQSADREHSHGLVVQIFVCQIRTTDVLVAHVIYDDLVCVRARVYVRQARRQRFVRGVHHDLGVQAERLRHAPAVGESLSGVALVGGPPPDGEKIFDFLF